MPTIKTKRGGLLTAVVGVAVVGTFAAAAFASTGFGRVTTLLVAKADNNETVQLNDDQIKFQTPFLQAATAAGITSRASCSWRCSRAR